MTAVTAWAGRQKSEDSTDGSAFLEPRTGSRLAPIQGRERMGRGFKDTSFIDFHCTRGMWDLSSLTRDQTLAPCIGSAKS